MDRTGFLLKKVISDQMTIIVRPASKTDTSLRKYLLTRQLKYHSRAGLQMRLNKKKVGLVEANERTKRRFVFVSFCNVEGLLNQMSPLIVNSIVHLQALD